MALDVDAMQQEIREANGAMSLTWAESALFYKIKMDEAAKNGGVTAYTLNGRTVTKDLRWWQEAYKFAKAQAAVDDEGGIVGCPISFGAPAYPTRWAR